MKTILATCWLITALASAAILAAPVPANANEPRPMLILDEQEGNELIGGVVKERTVLELTVTDTVDETKETKLKLTTTTKYRKDRKDAKADDVTIGSRVIVNAKRDAEGNPEALEVTIIGTNPTE